MSRVEIVRRYVHERYPARRFLPLAVLLAGAGMVANPGSEGLAAAATVLVAARAAVVAWLIVLALRIWDDTEDRERDAQAHPERITLRDEAPTPLLWLACLSGAGAIVFVAAGPTPMTRLLGLVVLGIALVVWYRTRILLAPSPVVSALVVLLKYPLIAWLVSPGIANGSSGFASAAPALIAVYLLLCIHEALDDPELRRIVSQLTFSGRGSLP